MLTSCSPKWESSISLKWSTPITWLSQRSTRNICHPGNNSSFAILVVMFSDAVLDHFQHPRNAGELAGATAKVEVSNPVCGDVLQLAVRVENDRIVEARFLCRGCTTAIACASLLTERLR